jgi:transcriptional regulator with XRE-family HTH domain
MPTRRRHPIRQSEIVRLFAARLREVRLARGMTQAELARQADVTVSHLSRLESGAAAPGIDLVARLAQSLGTTVADLLQQAAAPDAIAVMRQRARKLCDDLTPVADLATLELVVSFLARVSAAASGR